MSLDWKNLAPHVPLGAGAVDYVERADGAGQEIVGWILADRSPILLGGPTGVGKSTELARAAADLQKHRVACLVPLDRWENMRRLTPDQMLIRIATRVVYIAETHLGQELSADLHDALERIEPWPEAKFGNTATTPTALAKHVLSEVARRSHQGRVTLFLDGLEKVSDGARGLELLAALANLPRDVELVVVIPWHAAFGPQAQTIIRDGERLVVARGLVVEDEAGGDGRALLQNVLLRRLGLPNESLDPDAVVGSLSVSVDRERGRVAAKRNVVSEAAILSGGIVRTFLQLMADAASYARLRRSGEWPLREDLEDACRDQVDSIRRLLLPGDTAAIREHVGTDGRELELQRKVRLMAQGILLERQVRGVPELCVHPLAQIVIEKA